MPCYDSRDSKDDCDKIKVVQAPRSLLCEACRVLESNNNLNCVSKELLDWWKKHKIEDLEVQNRLKAAEKLSIYERELLGIDLDRIKNGYIK